MSERESTSFCGLWCDGCIPSNERLFALIKELNQLLYDINFEQYAKYKSSKVPELMHYHEFIDVLNSIEKLHCYNHCYLGPISCAGCSSGCKIRICVLENNFEGCWQCQDFESCLHIDNMKKMHPNIIDNLHAIRKYGIENWSQYKAKHYDFSFLI